MMGISSESKGEENFTNAEMNELQCAFERLFKDTFFSLCEYCIYKFRFDDELAKDIVHTAFLKLWENPDRLLHLSSKGYLIKIITNLSLDHIRHQQVERRHQSYLANQGISVQTVQPGASGIERDVEKAVSSLPHQMRKIFILCRFEKMKYAEVATHLKISVKTVETQMSRALAKLRQKLSHYVNISLFSSLLSIIS